MQPGRTPQPALAVPLPNLSALGGSVRTLQLLTPCVGTSCGLQSSEVSPAGQARQAETLPLAAPGDSQGLAEVGGKDPGGDNDGDALHVLPGVPGRPEPLQPRELT